MFGEKQSYFSIGSSPYINVQRGSNLTRNEARGGIIPVVGGGIKPSCYHNESNRNGNVITVSGSGANAGYISYWKEPIFATDCNTVESIDINKINPLYLYYSMLLKQEDLYELQKGNAQPHIYADDIKQILIIDAEIEKQTQFASYVEEIDKLKFEGEIYIVMIW